MCLPAPLSPQGKLLKFYHPAFLCFPKHFKGLAIDEDNEYEMWFMCSVCATEQDHVLGC